MRPILSATKTYNCDLAKWLEEKLKPLSINERTITNLFKFAEEIRNTSFNDNDIIMMYNAKSLFNTVPLDETISLLAEKAFTNNWFNTTHNLNITKSGLIELLTIAMKISCFNSMANFTNSQRVWLWVLLSFLSWPTPSCVVLKNNLSSGANYHHTTTTILMIL